MIGKHGSNKGIIAFLKPIRQCSSTATAAEPKESLHHRLIAPHLHPTLSISSVLNQWLEEGHNVDIQELHKIINSLRHDGLFQHALQVHQWMSEKTKHKFSKGDVSVRFDLISRVDGPEQAVEYFNNIEGQSNYVEVYANILHSYAREKSVDKAEILMNKLRDSGLGNATICYNAMLNLYRRIDDREKIEALILEMEDRDVKYDKFTFSLLLGTYSDASYIEGIERVLQKMEFGPKVPLDWELYSTAANAFIKAGIFEKAFIILKKSENLVTSKTQSAAFDFLLKQYATIGKKEEVFRIWQLRKQRDKPENNSYMAMIFSLVNLGDLESAEMIFNEWESSELSYDLRIPNYLMGAYGKVGLVEKAEALIERVKMKGGIPNQSTFYYLATAYIVNKEMEKALEAMRTAVITSKIRWRPSIASVEACSMHLKEKGDVEEANNFLKLLLDKGAVAADTYSKLSNDLKESGNMQTENL